MRATLITGGLLIALTAGPSVPLVQEVAALEPLCPGGATADPLVLFCDDFEDGTWLDSWSASPWCCDLDLDGIVSLPETNGVMCGQEGYGDNCAAWTNYARYGQHYADRPFALVGQEEVYVRWYAYVSPNFLWGDTGDKSLILHDGTAAIFNPYVTLNQFGTAQPTVVVNNNSLTPCVSQLTPNLNGEYPACVNRRQNVGNDITLQPGRWYLFEWHLKLNDPGVPNGVTRLWVDDASAPIGQQTLRASYNDIFLRADFHIGVLLRHVWLSAFHNTNPPDPDQYVKWDNLVISLGPIGPLRGWEEDFEAAPTDAFGRIWGWDGPADPSTLYLTDQVSKSGARAVELRYEPETHGASYMFKHFAGLDQLYHRWYQRWSPGFQWEASGTGMVGIRPQNWYPQFYPAVLWGNGELAISAVGILEADWGTRNFYQNQGSPAVFEPDRWYCVEVFVKLNTPGASDGELAAWIDGTLQLLHTGRRFRGAGPTDPVPSTTRIDSILISGYYGGVTTVPARQFSWQDDHVVSTRRIGCLPDVP
jgi:hypothetical protein